MLLSRTKSLQVLFTRQSQHITSSIRNMSSTVDMYVAIKGSEGKLASTQVAPSSIATEVERLWSHSRANDKAGETVSTRSQPVKLQGGVTLIIPRCAHSLASATWFFLLWTRSAHFLWCRGQDCRCCIDWKELFVGQQVGRSC